MINGTARVITTVDATMFSMDCKFVRMIEFSIMVSRYPAKKGQNVTSEAIKTMKEKI